MSTPARIAFLGLGTMGTGMAGRLLDGRFPLAVYNRSSAKADALRARGATVAATPRQAADGADVVVSMVADDEASGRVWLGDDGALAGAKRGAVLVECSTVSPAWVRTLAASAEQRGCKLLDAPVTGSKPQAAAGQLLFLVGGSAAALEIARPALAAMSRDILHLGPTGSGALLKLINNFVCAAQVATLAEAIALIERTKLDPDKALSVLTDGAPGSPLVKTISARMTSRDFTPNFSLKLMIKDVSYAIDEAAAHSAPLSMAGATLAVMQEALRRGHGEEDFSAVIEPLRASAPPGGDLENES